MAQTLLDRCGSKSSKSISKNWIYKFLSQHPELDARLARSHDAQQAKNKDPKIITEWFQRVQQTREEYGILDEDIYNFDETGFAMGLINLRSSKVITTDTIGRATII